MVDFSKVMIGDYVHVRMLVTRIGGKTFDAESSHSQGPTHGWDSVVAHEPRGLQAGDDVESSFPYGGGKLLAIDGGIGFVKLSGGGYKLVNAEYLTRVA